MNAFKMSIKLTVGLTAGLTVFWLVAGCGDIAENKGDVCDVCTTIADCKDGLQCKLFPAVGGVVGINRCAVEETLICP